jgi:DNA-nicking Smr family endonuclease
VFSSENAYSRRPDMLYTTSHGEGPRSVQGGDGRRASAQGRPRPVVAKPQGERSVKPRERSPAPAAIIKSHAPQTFDRDVDRALSRGRRAPQAKLDLHGMTLAAAEKAVAQFLAESSEQGRRLVLIVTGKGLRLAVAASSAVASG